MSLFKFRSPLVAQWVYPSLTWNMPVRDRSVFLTFDDGPTPEVTDRVLGLLEAFDAKATFFCLGKNVAEFPDLMQRIILSGHAIGNHTHDHLSGWRVPTKEYIENVEKASHRIESKLFRPPYGKITPGQVRLLQGKFQIIMWSILSRDFESDLNIDRALRAMKAATKPGAILVFHDSQKAAKQLFRLLPAYLEFIKSEGYRATIIES